MIWIYIKIAWRNSARNWFHSVINVLGLAAGLAFTLLISAYVWSESRVNKNLKNYRNQYIIQSKWTNPDMGLEITTTGPLGKALKEQYPTLVKNYYRWDGVTSNVSKGDKVFREGLQIGDSTLLTMYGFTLLHGDPATALTQPFSIVIREDRALKYFGKTDVVGETLTIQSFSGTRHEFQITGVLKQPGENSVTFLNRENDNALFIPESSVRFFGRSLDDWNNGYIVNYVELNDGVSPETLKQPMQRLLDQNAPAPFAAHMHPYLASLSDYYLEKDNGLVKKMLYVVSFIAMFILLMAVINFVNVSISHSSSRIREIGVRKVLGSRRSQLIGQLLIESIVLVSLSTLLAIVISLLVRPWFAGVIGKPIPPVSAYPAWFILYPVALVFLIGLLAGAYPALLLSAMRAVDSLKGKLKSVKEKSLLRQLLAGFQFFTAAVVLTGAIIISRQLSLFFKNDLGFDKEYVISAQVPRNWTAEGVEKMKTIRDEFSRMPQVSSVSLSWQVPNGWDNGNVLLHPQGKDSTQGVNTELMFTDEKYLEAFRIPLLAGRYLETTADSSSVVLNESAVRAFGWKRVEEAVGRQVYFPQNAAFTVVGVVKDFHFNSLKDRIQPTALTHLRFNNTYRFLSFKLKPGTIGISIAALQKKWSALLPGSAFEYNFIDESLERLYSNEIRLKKASQVATLLAFGIVLLGVMGLMAISIRKRVKEIGIRKVLGASLGDLSRLFLKEFLPVMLLGGLVSVPVAWYVMKGWLDDYAYRILLTASPFLVALGSLILLTSLLIVLQIGRASRANPVLSLRSE